MNTRHFILALLPCLALLSPAGANDWYQWRGPEQNGVSREKGLPESWSPDGENLVWKDDVGGMSSPIVMKGRVYTLTRVGEQPYPNAESMQTLVASPRTQEAVVCVDAATGKRLWEYRENITQSEVPFHRLGWSNVVGDPETGRVYALMVHCSLVCLDGNDGKLLWKRQMTEEFGMISTFGGRTPSPALEGDQVYIAGVAFGWGDHARSQHRIFALDKNTGQLNWSAGTGGIPVDAPYNTPVITVIGGQKLVIFAAGDGGVHAFQARTGKPVWSYKASKRGLNASVVVNGSRVYVCHSEENIDDSQMGAISCIDVADGKVKEVWRTEGIEAGFGSPTIFGDRLYVVDNKSTVHALDLSTGKPQWRKNTGTIGKASLVWGDGKIYVCEANGRVVILQPGERSAKVLSKVEIPEKFGREYAIFGSAAIADGRVYIQAANSMYCIGSPNATAVNEPIPQQPQEEPVPADAKPAIVQVRPADIVLHPGQRIRFTAFSFDEKGRPLGQVEPDWSIGQLTMIPPPNAPSTQPTLVGNLKGEVDRNGIFTAAGGPHQGGAIFASAGDVKGAARVRVLPPLPWKFDFEQAPIDKPPLTWLGAGGKFAVKDDNGNKCLVKTPDFDLYYRARTNFGDVNMANYTLQADVKAGEKIVAGEHHIPDPGIINQRYVLVLLGNHQRLQVQVWPPTLPYSLNKTISFPWKANTWYTMKLQVDQSADKAIVRGKVWPAGSTEPGQWNIELEDAVPNRNGNPGLFGHSLVTPYKSEIYYDNIIVTDNRK